MIGRTKQRILSSAWLKNTLFLTLSTILVQLITVAISPILSRLYSPEDFGLLGKLTAYTSIFAVISTLKFDMAIMLSTSPKETKFLINCSEFLIIAISLIAIPIYAMLYSNGDPFILFIVFLLIFLNGNLSLFTNIHSRYKNFKGLALASVANRLSSAIYQITFGFFLNNVFSLIIGQLIGLLTYFSYLNKKSKYSILKVIRFDLKNFKDAKPVLKKHYRFPLYTAPQVFLNSLSQNIPLLLMDSFFGSSVIGFYWFSMRIISMPIGAVASSFRQTFYQKASLINSNQELLKLYIKSTKLLFLIGLPFVILGFIFSPFIFSLVFGDEWKEAGLYTRWLLPWLFFGLINPPSSVLINVLNLQKFNLMYDVTLFLFRFTSIFLGGTYLGALETIKIFSGVGVLFNIFYISFVYYYLKNQIRYNHYRNP